MRKLILLFLLVSIGATGQTHQKDILSYVDQNLGKKVGKGLCYELVQGAFLQYNPSYNMKSAVKNIDRYGKKIKITDIQPGDIILEQGGLSHVCIVYKVENGKIFVAEQNTGDKLKDSAVEINVLNMEWLKEYYKAEFYFFRPE